MPVPFRDVVERRVQAIDVPRSIARVAQEQRHAKAVLFVVALFADLPRSHSFVHQPYAYIPWFACARVHLCAPTQTWHLDCSIRQMRLRSAMLSSSFTTLSPRHHRRAKSENERMAIERERARDTRRMPRMAHGSGHVGCVSNAQASPQHVGAGFRANVVALRARRGDFSLLLGDASWAEHSIRLLPDAGLKALRSNPPANQLKRCGRYAVAHWWATAHGAADARLFCSGGWTEHAPGRPTHV